MREIEKTIDRANTGPGDVDARWADSAEDMRSAWRDSKTNIPTLPKKYDYTPAAGVTEFNSRLATIRTLDSGTDKEWLRRNIGQIPETKDQGREDYNKAKEMREKLVSQGTLMYDQVQEELGPLIQTKVDLQADRVSLLKTINALQKQGAPKEQIDLMREQIEKEIEPAIDQLSGQIYTAQNDLYEYNRIIAEAGNDVQGTLETTTKEFYNNTVSNLPRLAASLITATDGIIKAPERLIYDAMLNSGSEFSPTLKMYAATQQTMLDMNDMSMDAMWNVAADASEYMAMNVDQRPERAMARLTGQTAGQLTQMVGISALAGPYAAMAVGGALSADEMMVSAMDSGLSYKDASTLAGIYMPIGAVLEYWGASKAISILERKAIHRYLIDNVLKGKIIPNKKSILAGIEAYVKENGKDIGLGTLGEVVTEGSQFVAQDLVQKGYDKLQEDGAPKFNSPEFLSSEWKKAVGENAGAGGYAGFLITAATSILGGRKRNFSQMKETILSPGGYAAMQKEIELVYNKNQVDESTKAEALQQLSDLQEILKNMPSGLNRQQQMEYTKLAMEGYKIERDTDSGNSAGRARAKNKANAIQEELDKIEGIEPKEGKKGKKPKGKKEKAKTEPKPTKTEVEPVKTEAPKVQAKDKPRNLTKQEKSDLEKKYNVTIEDNIEALPEITAKGKGKKAALQREAALAEITEMVTPKQAEPQTQNIKETAETIKPKIKFAKADGGYQPIQGKEMPNIGDPRDFNEMGSSRKSGVKEVDNKGKKNKVATIYLDTDNESLEKIIGNDSGRSGAYYAVVEDNGNLPDNIDQILMEQLLDQIDNDPRLKEVEGDPVKNRAEILESFKNTKADETPKAEVPAKKDGDTGTKPEVKEVSPKTKASDKKEATPAEQVETLRAEEQADLLEAIPNIEEAKVDGKVDRSKLSDADKKKFDEIYEKYDKPITALLKQETATKTPKKSKVAADLKKAADKQDPVAAKKAIGTGLESTVAPKAKVVKTKAGKKAKRQPKQPKTTEEVTRIFNDQQRVIDEVYNGADVVPSDTMADIQYKTEQKVLKDPENTEAHMQEMADEIRANYDTIVDEMKTTLSEKYMQEFKAPTGFSAVQTQIAKILTKNGISREDFIRWKDKNSITFNLAKTWFSKQGDKPAQDIASLAGNVTEGEGDAGVERLAGEITPDDIVDFMVEFPNGMPLSPTQASIDEIMGQYTGKKFNKLSAKAQLNKKAEAEAQKESEKEPDPDMPFSKRVAAAKDIIKVRRKGVKEFISASIEFLIKSIDAPFVFEQAAFDKALAEIGGDPAITKGFMLDGVVYINPKLATRDTAVHEYAHIYLAALRESNTELYMRGNRLIKDSAIYQEVKRNPAYAHLTPFEQADEAMAQAIGMRGAKQLQRALGSKSMADKFMAWLEDMKNALGQTLFHQKAENIYTMTLDEFLDGTVFDLLGGQELKVKTGDTSTSMANLISTTSTSVAKLQVAYDLFYSNSDKSVQNMSDQPRTPEQWLKEIVKNGTKGTSQELDWIGLEDFLNNYMQENSVKSVSKEVVERYIDDNRIKINEVRKGDIGNINSQYGNFLESEIPSKIDYIKANKSNLTIEKNRKGTWNIYDNTNSPLPVLKEISSEANAKDIINNPTKYEKSKPTKYQTYVLPDGENYQEVLLTTPDKKVKQEFSIAENDDGTFNVVSKRTASVMFPTHKTMKEAEVHRDRLYGTLPSDKMVYNSKENYDSPHWDEANILAHVRMNDRTLENGEKVLFVEEIQSDWAQEGKKRGFDNPKVSLESLKKEKDALEKEHDKLLEKFNGFIDDNWDKKSIDTDSKRLAVIDKFEEGIVKSPNITPESVQTIVSKIDGFNPSSEVDYNDLANSFIRGEKIVDRENQLQKEIYQAEKGKKIPDMPYKKTDQWVGMAIRRVLKMAADKGYARVAWVTGEQSAERYDLSKQVDEIQYLKREDDNTYDITASKSDEIVFNKQGIQESELEGIVGKELAQKVVNGESSSEGKKGRKVIEGADLKVGGEGMKAFYNSILPKVAKKEAQRFDKNAKIEIISLENRDIEVDLKQYGTSVPLDVRSAISAYQQKVASQEQITKILEDGGYKNITFREQDGALMSMIKDGQDIKVTYETGQQQLSIPITPIMSVELQTKGTPLFQSGFDGHAEIKAIVELLQSQGFTNDEIIAALEAEGYNGAEAMAVMTFGDLLGDQIVQAFEGIDMKSVTLPDTQESSKANSLYARKIATAISKAFPGVKVSFDFNEFREKIVALGDEYAGQKVIVDMDGTIYFNPATITPHETFKTFAKAWVLPAMQNRPELLQQVKAVMEGTKELQAAKDRGSRNPHLDALTDAIADKALKMDEQPDNFKQKYRRLLNSIFNAFTKPMIQAGFWSGKMSAKDIESLTLEGFTKKVAEQLTMDQALSPHVQAMFNNSLRDENIFKEFVTIHQSRDFNKIRQSVLMAITRGADPAGIEKYIVDKLGMDPKLASVVMERVKAEADYLRNDATKIPLAMTKWGEILASFRQMFQDSNIYLKKVQQAIEKMSKENLPDDLNAYVKKELARAKFTKQIEDLKTYIYGADPGSLLQISGRSTVFEGRKQNKASLKGRLEKAGLKLKDLSDYMYALHVPERNARLKEMSIKKQEAEVARLMTLMQESNDPRRQMLYASQIDAIEQGLNPDFSIVEQGARMSDAEAAAVIESYSEKQENLDDFAKEFQEEVIEKNLDLLYENGFLGDEQYAALIEGDKTGSSVNWANYMPVQIDPAFFGEASSRGNSSVNANILSAEGRGPWTREQVVDPINQAVMNLAKTIQQVERNASNVALVEMARKYDDPSVWRIHPARGIPDFDPDTGEMIDFKDLVPDNVKTNSVKVRMPNNKVVYLEVKHPGLHKSLLGETKPLNDFEKLLVATFGTLTNMQRALITSLNPFFAGPNFTRDLQDVFTNLSIEKDRYDLNGIKRAYLKKIPSAGRTLAKGYFAASDKGGDMMKYLQEAKEAGMYMSWANYGDMQDQIEQLQKLGEKSKNNTLDATVTQQVIHGVMDVALGINEVLEMSNRLAAYAALREAGLTTQQAATAAKNVSLNFEKKGDSVTVLNSMYLFLNAGIQGVFKTAQLLKSPSGRKALAAFTAAAYLNKQLLYSLLDDEEELKMMTERDIDWMQNTYIYNPFNPSMPFKLPKPYSFIRLFMSIGESAADVQSGRITPIKAVFNLLGATQMVVDPVTGNQSNWVSALAPVGVSQGAEIWMNKDYKDSPIYPEYDLGKADYELYFKNTDELYIESAQKLAEETGVSISPETLNYLIDEVFGGVVKEIVNVATYKAEDGVAQMPLARRFLEDLDNEDFRWTGTIYRYVKSMPNEKITEKEQNLVYEAYQRAIVQPDAPQVTPSVSNALKKLMLVQYSIDIGQDTWEDAKKEGPFAKELYDMKQEIKKEKEALKESLNQELKD